MSCCWTATRGSSWTTCSMYYRRTEDSVVKRIATALALTAAVCVSLLAAPAVSPRAIAGNAPSAAQTARPVAAAAPSILPNANGSVKFAVIGDTGTGGREQYEVGKLLFDARTRFPYEFVL